MNNQYTNKNIISGFFWKFNERITAQLISLVVSIVLARLLSPNEYGIVALVMIFISIANIFVSSGFGTALIQKKNADELDFSSVFWINMLFGIIIYALLFVFSPFLALFYEMPDLCMVFRVLGLRIVIASVNSIQHAYISKRMQFKRFFVSTITGTIISGIVGIIMAYNGAGVWALVAQYLINASVDTLVLWFTVKWRPKFQCSFKRAVGLFSFGWKILVSGLLDTGYNQLRGLLIGKVYTSSDLAYYNQGDKFPNLIVTNINATIQSVIYPVLSNSQDDKTKLKNMTRQSIRISSYLIWPLMIGLASVAEPFIEIVLGDKWIACVPYIRIFAISYAFWPIHTANLQAIKALGRSDLFLKLEIIKKTNGLVVILLSVKYGPIVLACGEIYTGVVDAFINAYPNSKLLGYSCKEQLEDMLPSALIAIAMGGLLYLISTIKISALFILAIQISTGVAVYITLSILFKNTAYYSLLNVFRTMTKRKTRNEL